MSEPALHVLDGARFTSGWDALWTRDQWHERELPHGQVDDGPGRGVILHVGGLAQPWLKKAAKRWARARLLAATAPQSMKGYLIERRAFSRWLLQRAPQAHSPAAISRELLTDYILFIRASPLKPATQQARARGALADLDRAGEDITFAAVARRAHVSRQFLYRHDTLRTEIAQLRTSPARTSPTIPAHHRASENSRHTRLRAALDENQHLRTELTRLRGELAVALGRNRELELDRRSS